MTPEELAQEISNFVNGASKSDIEELAKQITGDHRTLQQITFSMMMKCVELWAEQKYNGYGDARNEMTLTSAMQIVNHLDMKHNQDAPLFLDGKLLGLPYI